jgi:hypothetical protein
MCHLPPPGTSEGWLSDTALLLLAIQEVMRLAYALDSACERAVVKENVALRLKQSTYSGTLVNHALGGRLI